MKMDTISGITQKQAAYTRRILGKVAHIDGGLVRECSELSPRMWLRPLRLHNMPTFECQNATFECQNAIIVIIVIIIIIITVIIIIIIVIIIVIIIGIIIGIIIHTIITIIIVIIKYDMKLNVG